MYISELIVLLEAARKKHGDLPVFKNSIDYDFESYFGSAKLDQVSEIGVEQNDYNPECYYAVLK